MPPLISGIAYIAVCLMCRGAGKWNPKILPHCAMASSPQYAPMVIAPVILVLVFLTVGGTLLNVEWWWFVEILSMSVLIGLILDATRRLTSPRSIATSSDQHENDEAETSSTEENNASSETPQFVLVSGPEPELIKMEADFRLSTMMGPTPFRETRIATVEAIEAIQNVSPAATIVPWPEELNDKIFMRYVEKDNLCKEKIAEAMASETGKMATVLENKELIGKLKETQEANKKYEKVLQDLRSKPANVSSDYTKMTPSQRGEEEKRLRESLQKIQELSKKPSLPPISIPSYFKQPGAIE